MTEQDLIARLRGRSQFCKDRGEVKSPDLMNEAADRIEVLVEERDGYLAERNKFKLYLQRTHADLELEVAAVDALSGKLAKAVEALRGILKGDDLYPWRIAREVLAELGGK